MGRCTDEKWVKKKKKGKTTRPIGNCAFLSIGGSNEMTHRLLIFFFFSFIFFSFFKGKKEETEELSLPPQSI